MMARTKSKAECGRLGGLATRRRHGRAHFRAAGALGFNATVARHWQGDRAGYAAWLRQNARLAAVEAAADILFRNGATCVEFDDDLPELPF